MLVNLCRPYGASMSALCAPTVETVGYDVPSLRDFA